MDMGIVAPTAGLEPTLLAVLGSVWMITITLSMFPDAITLSTLTCLGGSLLIANTALVPLRFSRM